MARGEWRRLAGGDGVANGCAPSGKVEVEGAGKQGGGGCIWRVARVSRGRRRLRDSAAAAASRKANRSARSAGVYVREEGL